MPRALHCALLVSAVLLAYANAFQASFQFDDFNVIVDNPTVHSWQAWLASMPGIRPLLKWTYTLNWTSDWGTTGFHAVNILVHGVNAVLVYMLALHWIRLFPGIAASDMPALLAALLFALHPAQTEAVTYVSGRSVSLMATFYLAAMLLWLYGEGRWRSMVSPMLMLAALMVKETAWTLPFALLLWEYAHGRSLRASMLSLKNHWLMLAMAAAAMFAIPGYRHLLEGSLAAREFGQNLLAQVEGQFYLLSHPLLALQTNIDPDITLPLQPDLPWALKFGVLSGLLVWGLREMQHRPWLGMGVLWFFLHLLPTNSLLPRADIANDRQLYLAMIGPALLVAASLCHDLAKPRAALAGLALVLLLGSATLLRNEDYRTEVALWRETVRDSPHKARVWNNLGYAYRLAGNAVQARQAYQKALSLDPQDIQARANLMALDGSSR
jgi:hypothetical protein